METAIRRLYPMYMPGVLMLSTLCLYSVHSCPPSRRPLSFREMDRAEMRFFPNKSPEESIDLALEKLGDVSKEEREEFVHHAWILWELTERRRQGPLDAKERAALKKAIYATRRGSSFGQLRSINLKMTPELLWKIDNAARDQGMDRSNWIRSVCTAATSEQPDLSRPGRPQLRITNSGELVEEAEVIDKRARQIIRDLVKRVRDLEEGMRSMNSSAGEIDPFD